jgi:hypothetical protein
MISIRIRWSGEVMEDLVLLRGVMSSRSCAGVIGNDPDGQKRKGSSSSFGRLWWVGVWFILDQGVLGSLHIEMSKSGDVYIFIPSVVDGWGRSCLKDDKSFWGLNPQREPIFPQSGRRNDKRKYVDNFLIVCRMSVG